MFLLLWVFPLLCPFACSLVLLACSPFPLGRSLFCWLESPFGRPRFHAIVQSDTRHHFVRPSVCPPVRPFVSFVMASCLRSPQLLSTAALPSFLPFSVFCPLLSSLVAAFHLPQPSAIQLTKPTINQPTNHQPPTINHQPLNNHHQPTNNDQQRPTTTTTNNDEQQRTTTTTNDQQQRTTTTNNEQQQTWPSALGPRASVPTHKRTKEGSKERRKEGSNERTNERTTGPRRSSFSLRHSLTHSLRAHSSQPQSVSQRLSQ